MLSLALLSWENKQIDEAKLYFNKLLDMKHRADEANIYLARIAASEKDFDLARAWSTLFWSSSISAIWICASGY